MPPSAALRRTDDWPCTRRLFCYRLSDPFHKPKRVQRKGRKGTQWKRKLKVCSQYAHEYPWYARLGSMGFQGHPEDLNGVQRKVRKGTLRKAPSKLVHDPLDAVLHVYDVEIEQVSKL